MIALMAVLALLVNPVAAAAAQIACEESRAAMSQMDQQHSPMAAMPGMDQVAAVHQASSDPCCGHSGDQKMDDKTCAQACATACALLVALSFAPESQTLVYMRAPSPVARLVWPPAYHPAGLERPPKSMA